MDKRTLIWSDPAKADLAAILDFYYRRNGNSEYSNKLIRDFHERLSDVIDGPYSGQRWKKSRFRFLIVYPFQLFYYVTKTEVVVVAVWDARRDPKTLKLIR
jgi:toxin YoeB